MRRTVLTAVSILSLCLIGYGLYAERQNEEPTKVYLNCKLDNTLSQYDSLIGMDKEILSYLRKWKIKGASLAIMRNDSLVYAKGYGWADQEKGEKMDVKHILRMASVSKLITAVGIMVLQDEGKLNIKDKVFGPAGVLKNTYLDSLATDTLINDITIEHLLRHEAGWKKDYVFSPIMVKNSLRLKKAPEADDFFRFTLPKELGFAPGTSQKYSNFGYLLLSRIIEVVSGETYETFIKSKVLYPAGCYDMHIGGNYYADKRPNEVRYYTHDCPDKFVYEFNGSGRKVERSYGGNNVTVLSGAGAWCGSPVEIARFVATIDGRDEVPDIISKEAVRQMTEYFTKEKFSLGWNDTNPESGWKRTGTLSGTSALVKYYPDNQCWIMITNTSTWKGSTLTTDTDSLFIKCRELYGHNLPRKDMFR